MPDDLAVEPFALNDLPADWRRQEGWTQQRGDRWHDSLSTPLLRVPSAIVPVDQSPDVNILINHNHTAAQRISLVSVEPFVLDPLVAAVALASLVLTLVLGHAISRSVIEPVRIIHDGLNRIAAGDFTQRIAVPNRDELGELAAHVNSTCEELQQLYRSLEEASLHKSQFLANMSHELRTPLNAILGFSELLLDGIYGNPPDKMRSAVERIQRNGRHLLGLINDVLDLSKIEAGQLRLSVADYSVEELVSGVYISVESLAAEKKLGLRIAVPPGLPPARGDERRLAQALFNLVGNAIKFTDEGEVRIEVEAKGDSYKFSVQDTGPGIDEADQTKIFQEFQQLDNSITKTKGGAGLGLAIVKRIVEMHGGRIWIESRLGHGATFSFLVPARLEQQATRT